MPDLDVVTSPPNVGEAVVLPNAGAAAGAGVEANAGAAVAEGTGPNEPPGLLGAVLLGGGGNPPLLAPPNFS